MAVLPHLLRQPGGRLPRVAEDHRLDNSSHVNIVHLHNGNTCKTVRTPTKCYTSTKTAQIHNTAAKWHNVPRQTLIGGKQLFYKKKIVIKSVFRIRIRI